MEKKGDLLNQLAIISDLVEKINLQTDNSTLVLELSELEFYKVYDYVCKKQNRRTSSPGKSFTIKMGVLDIVFNRNSGEKAQSS